MKQSRIDALRAMAARGTPNEAKRAKEILREAGIPIRPITDGNEPVPVQFAFKDAFERKLIFQTFLSIFPEVEAISYYIVSSHKIEINVPSTHKNLCIEKANAIIRDYRQQLKLFQVAFVEKNNLFGHSPPPPPDEPSPFSVDDLKQIAYQMLGIKRTKIDRALK